MSVDPPTDPPHRPRRAAFRAFPLRIVALIAVLGLIGFGAGYLGIWPPFATVMSGSMSPTIKTGDVVLLKRLVAAPRVGDIVQVSVPDAARSRYGYPPVVVHRVVHVSADGTITTKGDALPRPDPFTVPRTSVSARVVLHIPAAGRIFAFLTSPMGLLWIAGGVAMFFIVPLFERRQEAEDAEQETLAAVRAELHAISEELARLHHPEPVQQPPPPAEEEPMPPSAETLPKVDWVDLETTTELDLEPHWPEPPEFLPGYVPYGRQPAAPQPEPEPEPEVVTYTVRRRSGGLLARLR